MTDASTDLGPTAVPTDQAACEGDTLEEGQATSERESSSVVAREDDLGPNGLGPTPVCMRGPQCDCSR